MLVLLLSGIETNYWPSHDFPLAYWHEKDRGLDIEVAQANAAKAGWKELWGYWVGPMIHGHGYYRPITSWLFVLQYRVFGTADGKWAFVNIGLHLAVCALLVWAGGVLAGGSQTRRVAIGTAAALLVGAPLLADRDVQFWICGWWPCQSEMLSLLAGLTLLASTVRFVETGRRRWLGLGVSAMVLGILCKEMTYVAALGACLLLLRHRRRWWGGMWIAAPALLLFIFRKWAIRNAKTEGGIPLDDLVGRLQYYTSHAFDEIIAAGYHIAGLVLGVALAWMLLRRSGVLERAIAAGVAYFFIVSVILGFPWETPAWFHSKVLLRDAFAIVVLMGLARAAKRWPVPELVAIWLLTQAPALGFNPIFAWYRYWGSVFGALLLAIALWELIEWKVAPLIPCPKRNRPQTPESPPPAGGGSLATGPSTA